MLQVILKSVSFMALDKLEAEFKSIFVKNLKNIPRMVVSKS